MEVRQNGTRYLYYDKWETRKDRPYNYAREGLLKRIMSATILETTNPLLRRVLNFFEDSLVFLQKYVDVLAHFKDIHYRNR